MEFFACVSVVQALALSIHEMDTPDGLLNFIFSCTHLDLAVVSTILNYSDIIHYLQCRLYSKRICTE